MTRITGLSDLLSDTEVPEDNVENILDIDSPGEPAERARSQAELLGQQVFALGHWPSRCAGQGGESVVERPAMAGAGDQCGFRAGQECPGVALKAAQKLGKTQAGRRRKSEPRLI